MMTVTLVKPKEVKKKVQKEPEKKTVTVDMTPAKPRVAFTGEGWCVLDVKLAYAAIVRSFKEMQRELYRKEYKKK